MDLYLDGVLPSGEADQARQHLSSCQACEALVTGYQQAASLLRAAVADRAAAVDVSGLWQDIEARLGADLSPAAARSGWRDRVRQWWDSRPVLAPGLTSVRAGGWAAAMAAAVVVVSMSIPGLQAPQKGGNPLQLADNALTSQPLHALRTDRSKSVRIDSLEVAEGHTVTTWMRPRTNTRVIWIADNDDFGVSDASFSR